MWCLTPLSIDSPTSSFHLLFQLIHTCPPWKTELWVGPTPSNITITLYLPSQNNQTHLIHFNCPVKKIRIIILIQYFFSITFQHILLFIHDNIYDYYYLLWNNFKLIIELHIKMLQKKLSKYHYFFNFYFLFYFQADVKLLIWVAIIISICAVILYELHIKSLFM